MSEFTNFVTHYNITFSTFSNDGRIIAHQVRAVAWAATGLLSSDGRIIASGGCCQLLLPVAIIVPG
jgi:hypothetical protein